ncbi:MAG: hypothetical protein ACFCUR_12255 [Rhodomicrobiaceae bacterium]
MEAADSGLVLIAWQGWSVTGSITALLILLITILLWLLPFPPSSIAEQLADPAARDDLQNRYGAASPFTRYLIAMRRLNNWLHRWFGKRWSTQAFERCLAIAFVFPVALFLLATVLSGYKTGEIGSGALLLFLFGVVMVSIATRALFRLVYWFTGRKWRSIGGDSELAEIVARILLGAFAVVFAFAIAFAVASSVAGEISGVGTIALAIVGGFAFALAFAIAFAFAGLWAFLIALVLVAGIALTMAKDFAFFLLLFFVILPVLNALMDWLSWAVTRFNVSLIDIVRPGFSSALFVAAVLMVDIAIAIAFVIALAMLLPIGLELVDLLLSVFGRDNFDWRMAAAQAVQSPWDEGLFVTGMLLTPLVPTIGALTIGFAALVMPLTPGARAIRAAISDDPDTPPDADEIRNVSRIVYVSRIWYVPALALSLGIFLGIWFALDSIEVPVGQFLYDLALCSTAWSNGRCVWF